ncbi:MAG: ATP-binding protein, partial [Prosthecobacter sp.]|nr:ATP-binding protein [Prosthecobacter sp.]
MSGLLHAPGLPEKVLPVIAIYGANAAGKSSMLLAFEFFRLGILRSHNTTEKFRIGRESFRLGTVPDADTSSFECDFVLSEALLGKNTHTDVRYTYGFVISDDEVREEWLFAYPLHHRRVLFHRNSSETPVFHFGKDLKGNNKVISENTRKDSLFLSTANANNHGQLAQVYEYFRRVGIRTSDDLDSTGNLLSSFFEDDERRAKLLDYLKDADIGICDAEIAAPALDPGLVPLLDDFDNVLSKHFPNKINKADSATLISEIAKRKKIRLGHSSPDGIVYFDLKDESRGTLAYLNLMTAVILALATGRLLLIDELDSSLH